MRQMYALPLRKWVMRLCRAFVAKQVIVAFMRFVGLVGTQSLTQTFMI